MSDTPDDADDLRPSLFAVPGFWLAAAVSVMAWALLLDLCAKATE